MINEPLKNEQPCPIHRVGNRLLFDRSLVDKATTEQPEYVMCIDTYDKNAPTYCLVRKAGGGVEVLLGKTMRDEKEFKQEVENLAKYFNAKVVQEK